MKDAVRFVDYDKSFLDKSWVWLTTEPVKSLTNTPDFTREQQQKWFENLNNQKDYLVQGIKCGDIPIGVWGLKHITDKYAEYFGYIGEVNYWGQGIGNMIMKQAIKTARDMHLKQLYLTVLASNERAISLYRRFNFKEVSSKNKGNLLFMLLEL